MSTTRVPACELRGRAMARHGRTCDDGVPRARHNNTRKGGNSPRWGYAGCTRGCTEGACEPVAGMSRAEPGSGRAGQPSWPRIWPCHRARQASWPRIVLRRRARQPSRPPILPRHRARKPSRSWIARGLWPTGRPLQCRGERRDRVCLV
jgi:hypothetical protein